MTTRAEIVTVVGRDHSYTRMSIDFTDPDNPVSVELPTTVRVPNLATPVGWRREHLHDGAPWWGFVREHDGARVVLAELVDGVWCAAGATDLLNDLGIARAGRKLPRAARLDPTLGPIVDTELGKIRQDGTVIGLVPRVVAAGQTWGAGLDEDRDAVDVDDPVLERRAVSADAGGAVRADARRP